MKSEAEVRSVFGDELDRIEKYGGKSDIHAFVLLALQNAPDYFWTLPASTSGRYHQGDSLVTHVKNAFRFAVEVVYMQYRVAKVWGEEDSQIFLGAVLLHDLCRAGLPDQVRHGKDGKIHTDNLHPLYVREHTRKLKMPDTGKTCEGVEWYERMMQAIQYHMGPWTPLSDHMMMEPFAHLPNMVFACDFFASRMSIRFVDKK
jgi:hypothetical protein